MQTFTARSAELNRVNSHVFVSPADIIANGPDPSSPSCVSCQYKAVPLADVRTNSVIIVFGWFNARLSHEQKYVDGFKSIYPTSTLVLVKADSSWLWTSQAGREALLEPAADLVDRIRLDEGRQWRGVLLHAMSNGGGMQLLVFSKLLAKRPKTPSGLGGLNPAALVLDSVPDSNGLRCMVVVFTQAVRSPVKRVLAVPILALLYSLFAISYGLSPVLVDLRRRLNSPDLVPLAKRIGEERKGRGSTTPGQGDVPRLYFASKADTMTRFNQVKAHMDEARRLGFDVRAEISENIPHVSHAKVDPEGYWGAIKALWRDTRSALPTAKL
ncbi:uncharacterized protein PHACADRAFT_104693 [Phanerochaete carnosa HHB-10118-sp]|uniref:Indole-diterpene biosynthesis protein PaxU n=1 Tax=Phanerochaete carnosa (strain HHB-10118-sp) TaxID=650164 RepID=K5VUX5_PHACS|nr:uncharacterized protein PHACADRAFT_104693 [Phanerochaete carnosa HHB-10118-sp]EKM50364.1 hypothetical protein PHACADRAFT_104693 [Phanerochaete carnosa HHB-10118-sp]